MIVGNKKFTTIWYKDDSVKIIDQTLLPFKFKIKELKTINDFFLAIKNMCVRGAPLIGVTAAFGLALSIKRNSSIKSIEKSYEKLLSARPTAVNLKWALDSVFNSIKQLPDEKRWLKSINLAKKIRLQDIDNCKKIGTHGLKIIKKKYLQKKGVINILTHCNAGWLATVDWGTALSPIFSAKQNNIPIHVWVDETRPRNQGANLTSYELNEEEIPNTIIADNTGGILMQRGEVDMCIVGTDRTLSNGDVCNKIGTYLKALAAHDNNVPFYVALPSSTIDWDIKDAKDIPIEERNSEELSHVEGIDENNEIKKVLIYPTKSKAMNLAFDVTPAKYVTGLITERGISEASSEGLKKLFK